ncbi:hypothetical protein [Streptomyces sp. JV178]|uniref:hypothetical protein n=1 Tax=Streptomyces sp. JV178 TaxID=858632 RepID=UPI00117DBAE2|nr:hypothetical protein [Streptomyces sp. JV178]
MTQVLSIVDALAEHARLNDIPLPAQEVDHEVWANRLLSSLNEKKPGRQPSTENVSASEETVMEWNVEPLRQAHMTDLVNVIAENRFKPTSMWFPGVLRDLIDAEMDIMEFLKRAAQDSPLAIVDTLKALEEEFPYHVMASDGWRQDTRNEQNRATVGVLLRLVARQHGEKSTPGVVVALRRARLGHHVDEYLIHVGAWFAPQRMMNIFDHFERAALTNDIERLAHSIAQHRTPKGVPELVKLLLVAEKRNVANAILRKVGETNKWRVANVVEALVSTSAPEDVLFEIARSVPSRNHDDYAQHFEENGLKEFAEIMRKAKEDVTPPF